MPTLRPDGTRRPSKWLYVRLNSGNEFTEVPVYAAILVNARLVADVKRLQGVCKKHKLVDARVWDYGIIFGPMDDGSHDYRSECDRLAVTEEEFYYSGYEKHTSDHWSTHRVSVADLKRIADDKSGRMDWFGGYKRDSDWEELERDVREAQEQAEKAPA